MDSTSVPNTTQGTPAKYGRACTNCSRVKSRCIYRVDEDNCERCHRLNKDCHPSISARKRNPKKAPGSRTAQLEEKLDDIVSLLRSQASASQPQQTPPNLAYRDAPLRLDSILTPDSSTMSATDVLIDNASDSERNAHPTSVLARAQFSIDVSPSLFADSVSIHRIADATADEQLNTFRRSFLPFFSFVYIPDQMSASDLRSQKPFLWLVIMSLTTKSVAQQLVMGDTIQHIVSQKVIAEHEKNLDVLLGMTCYLAWFQYHKKEKSYQIMWTQIAVSLVFELGIHRLPPRNPGEEGQYSSRIAWFPPRLPISKLRTKEERRAVLGTFCLTSMVWTSLRQIEPLNWTSYTDECLRIVGQEPDTELDILLATQVKCHVIMNQMTRAPTEPDTNGEGFKPLPPYFVKAMRMQLQDIRRDLPAQLQTNMTTLLNIYGTEIIVQEALLTRPKVRDQTGLSDLQRLEGLDSILTAIERWLGVFLDMSPFELAGTTFNIFAQFSHCIILLFKLMTIDEPGWDANEMKKRANLFDVLDDLAQRLERIPSFLGLVDAVDTGKSGHLFKAPRLIRGMKAGFEVELAALVPKPVQTDLEPNEDAQNDAFMGELSLLDDYSLLLADDPWFTDMFSLHNL